MAAVEMLSRPLGKVDTSERMRHRISYWDEATPNKRAKPRHALGCEIWCVLAASIESRRLILRRIRASALIPPVRSRPNTPARMWARWRTICCDGWARPVKKGRGAILSRRRSWDNRKAESRNPNAEARNNIRISKFKCLNR